MRSADSRAATKAERAIVFLHCSDYCAGAERSLVEIAAGLTSRGHAVEVWNAGENPELARWLAERSVPLRSLPAPAYGTNDFFGFLRHGLVLSWRWLRRRPRLVHANNLTSAKYAAPFAALLRVPLICHWRNQPELDPLTRRLLRGASLVIAISEFIADAIGRIPGTPVQVLYNAIEIEAIEPKPPPADPGEPLRLVTPAAFRTDKRIELALACAARLRDAGCRFHWRICGPRPDASLLQGLEAKWKALELEGFVSLETAQPQDAVYDGANVVVSTSRWEPFGRTVIEGYARGLPIVAFASGALPELIEDGVTGRLVPDGDVAAMAEALEALAGDRERVLTLGRAGRELAERRFSLETLLDGLEAHHASLA